MFVDTTFSKDARDAQMRRRKQIQRRNNISKMPQVPVEAQEE